jgi:hypothetical protein
MPARDSAHLLIRTAQVFAVLCMLIVGIMSGPPSFSNASLAPPGLPGGIIGLQFVRTVSDVDSLLGDSPSPDREAARIKLYQDFAFIPCYTGLCISILLVIGKKNVLFRRYAAIGIVMALGAAVNDVNENLRLLRLLDLPLSATTAMRIESIRMAASTKWFLVAITSAILAWGLLSSKHRKPRVASAVCFAGGLLTLAGLAYIPLLPLAAVLLALGLLAAVATLKLLNQKQKHESPASSHPAHPVRSDSSRAR